MTTIANNSPDTISIINQIETMGKRKYIIPQVLRVFGPGVENLTTTKLKSSNAPGGMCEFRIDR